MAQPAGSFSGKQDSGFSGKPQARATYVRARMIPSLQSQKPQGRSGFGMRRLDAALDFGHPLVSIVP